MGMIKQGNLTIRLGLAIMMSMVDAGTLDIRNEPSSRFSTDGTLFSLVFAERTGDRGEDGESSDRVRSLATDRRDRKGGEACEVKGMAPRG